MALSSRRCAQLASFALALTCIPAHATVNQSMQDWFNEIGAYGNVTGPNAYRGQTMNMYTGGSLYMRTPVRNYQLASISPPSFSAGCGGIALALDLTLRERYNGRLTLDDYMRMM